MRYQRAEFPLRLDGLAAARAFFAGCFAESDPKRESLWVAHVDSGARCIHVSCHEGDETGAHFALRDIIIDAAVHRSAAIILAHNHPSRRRATRRLASAAEALDCTILDHLIFAGDECTSFRRTGIL